MQSRQQQEQSFVWLETVNTHYWYLSQWSRFLLKNLQKHQQTH